MNRARTLVTSVSPRALAAWGAAILAGGAVIVLALAAGRPVLLEFGLLAVLVLSGLIVLAARAGTAGWLAGAVLLAAGALPDRIYRLWQPFALGRAFDIVVVAVLVCGALVWLGRMLVQGSPKPAGLALPQAVVLVIGLAGLAIHAGDYADLDPVWRGMVRMFLPMLGFWVVATSRLEERRALMLVRLLLAVGAAMAILGLRWPLQMWRNPSASGLFGATGRWGFRTMTPVGGPGLSALALGMMLPISLAMAMLDKRWLRPVWALCALGMLAGVAMSVNRSGIIACLAAVLLFAWLNRGFLRRRLAVTAAVLVVAAAMVTGLFLAYRQYTPFARLARLVDLDSPSDRLRWYSARTALAIGSARPVFGSGIGRFYLRDRSMAPMLVEGAPTARDPHCLYLLGLAEMGIPGLLAVLWLVIKPLADLLRARRTAGAQHAILLAGFSAAALAMMSYSVTSCALFVHLRMAIVAWWTVALGYQFRDRPAALPAHSP
jgi:O-antigen ligase